MAWNGAGNFQRTNGSYSGATVWQDDQNAGYSITASRVDTHDQDIAQGINNCLAKDGQNAAAGNLNIGNYRLTAVGAATARTDAAQAAQVQDGDFIWLGNTAGTATAQTATSAPTFTAYKTGQKFRMKIAGGLGSTGSTNTAHTLNINGIGAKSIVNQSGTNPTIGTWVAGAILECVYDGTNFVITNDPGGWLTYTPTVTASGSMTVSSLVVNDAKYRKTGTTVELWLSLTMTLGGTASSTIYATLPINNIGYDGTTTFTNFTYDSATVVSYGLFANTSTLQFAKDLTAANWGLGPTKQVRTNFSYSAV